MGRGEKLNGQDRRQQAAGKMIAVVREHAVEQGDKEKVALVKGEAPLQIAQAGHNGKFLHPSHRGKMIKAAVVTVRAVDRQIGDPD